MFSLQPFLSKSIFPLKPSDKGEFALEMMDDWKIMCLPVVDEGKYLGVVEKSDLKPTTKIKDVVNTDVSFLIPEKTFLWKLLELFQTTGDQLKVVVDEEGRYRGCITPQNILRALNNSYTINTQGLYLRIDISGRDYSLAQIGHLAESEDVKIMGLWIFGDDIDELTILLKTNTLQVAGFIATLQRMGYVVTTQEFHDDSGSSDENRFGQLMKYLDI